MTLLHKILLATTLSMAALDLTAQPSPTGIEALDPDGDYQLPLADVKIALAGNYGELRPNHFHAGLDFKTDQTTGHPVLAFDDGYVWRAVIYAYGYGYALYVKHPQTGLMTVYGHLDAFRSDIARRVRQYCIDHEANNPDVYFEPDDFPVRRGEEIARSGNTGSSGGPHVHFEIRGIDNDEFYDPLPYFRSKIADTTPPQLYNVYIYASGEGRGRQSYSLVTPKGSTARQLNRQPTASGRIGIGIKAYDRMDGQANRFGVKHVRLYVDDTLHFQFDEERFYYDERRYTNSQTDYAAWRGQRSMIMKCFREPENHLRMVTTATDDGWLDIAAGRTYHIRLELEDAHGNTTTFPFTIKGQQAAAPAATAATRSRTLRYVPAGCPVAIDTLGLTFGLAAGHLYTDAWLRVAATPSADPKMPCVSPVYTIGHPDTPIHGTGRLTIAVPASFDGDGSRLYIANVTDGSKGISSTSTSRQDGALVLSADVSELGKYAIRRDTTPPVVSIVGKPSARRITVSIVERGSGIASWRGSIDGQFIPFDMDNRGLYVARPADFDVPRGRNHTVVLTATDRVGNQTTLRRVVWF